MEGERTTRADSVIPVPDVPEATNQLTWDVEPHLPTHRDQPPQPFGLRHVIRAAITLYRPHPPIYNTFLRQDGGIDRICSRKESHGCSVIKTTKIRGLSETLKAIKLLLIKISGITRNITHAPLFTLNFQILRLVFFGGAYTYSLSNVTTQLINHCLDVLKINRERFQPIIGRTVPLIFQNEDDLGMHALYCLTSKTKKLSK